MNDIVLLYYIRSPLYTFWHSGAALLKNIGSKTDLKSGKESFVLGISALKSVH